MYLLDDGTISANALVDLIKAAGIENQAEIDEAEAMLSTTQPGKPKRNATTKGSGVDTAKEMIQEIQAAHDSNLVNR